MEKYADYLRCGEIFKSPYQSDKSPYILKCFSCSDVFLLLESFIFHIEDYCKENVQSTLATVSDAPDQEPINIEMLDLNSAYGGDNCLEEKYVSEVDDDVLCIEEDNCQASNLNIDDDVDNDVELVEDSLVVVKNEPIADLDDVCVDKDNIYVSDVFDYDDSNDDTQENNDVAANCIQNSDEDTESADEDPHNTQADETGDESSPSTFILKFMASPINVLNFINAYKNRTKLWNKKIHPHCEDQYQTELETLTKLLNQQLKCNMSSTNVSEIISYMQWNFRRDLSAIYSAGAKKHKPRWYFNRLRFLQPFLDYLIFANVDKSLPPMMPEQIIEIINIYKTYPHLWDSTLAEYCCHNKRSESELLMLRTIQHRINLILTQPILQKLIRRIHAYFSQVKQKCLNSNTEIQNMSISDNEPNYYEHMKFLTDHVAPFTCPDCHFSCGSPFSIRMHMSKHTGSTPFVCSVCRKNFQSSGPYMSHVRLHMKDFQAVCTICGKRFLTQAELTTHGASHSMGTQFRCKMCDLTFTNMPALTNHKKIHQKRVLFKCRTCDKVFNSKNSIELHLRVHRVRNGSEGHVCTTCGKCFANGKELLEHEKMHVQAKRFKCRKCGKIYKTRFNFVQHMRTHGVTLIYKAEGVKLTGV